MRYCITVRVPGTDSLRYEEDRLASYTDSQGQTVNTAGQPFSIEERDAVIALVASSAIVPQVATIQSLKNATLPPEDDGRSAATIEVYPLYDASIAVADTLVNMEDAAIAVVPVAAIDAATQLGYLTAPQRTAALERLARIHKSKAPLEVQALLTVG